MNGAGNDFILIDNRTRSILLSKEQVQRLCHRQRGIGADGLLLLETNLTGKADWSWKFYNSDGEMAEMCGNGARCFAAFIRKVIHCSSPTSIETLAGVIHASFDGDDVTIALTEPERLALHQQISLLASNLTYHFLNTGVPHTVVFVDDADQAMVHEIGRQIRNHDVFSPGGTNVDFVQILRPGLIRVRTYERGVEGETLACGTGVAAAAIVTALVQKVTPPISVQVQGGETLSVDFTQTDVASVHNVLLTGPATFVFTGEITI
ncbi:diaminopimelate epimerase-like [Sycon ciliatum]|uniref:diaminopimelate epimerase-like n=1 Tax=Sycon ciliatum TaxID=27933 RepID=UPI0031F6B5F8